MHHKEDILTKFEILDTPFSKKYGTGSVNGTLAADEAQFAGFSIPFTFGLATEVSSEFEKFAIDGILGLGRSASDIPEASKTLDILAENQLIKSKSFGIYYSSIDAEANDSEINFGEPNPEKYDDELLYNNLVEGSDIWEIAVDDFEINSQSLDFGLRTVLIDSGTSFIVMPPADAEGLHSSISGSAMANGQYTIPCNASEDITVTFSGTKYSISNEDYVGPVASNGDGRSCLSNFISLTVFSDTQWIFGAVFMRNKYTFFDLDQSRIGFGKKMDPSPSEQTVTQEQIPTLSIDTEDDDEDDEESASGSTSSEIAGLETDIESSMLTSRAPVSLVIIPVTDPITPDIPTFITTSSFSPNSTSITAPYMNDTSSESPLALSSPTPTPFILPSTATLPLNMTTAVVTESQLLTNATITDISIKDTSTISASTRESQEESVANRIASFAHSYHVLSMVALAIFMFLC